MVIISLIFLLFSGLSFASGSIEKPQKKAVFIGPTFKIWCDLTKVGISNIGKDLKLKKSGKIYFLPKIESKTGEIPTLVAKDFSKKEEINEFFSTIAPFCSEKFDSLDDYLAKIVPNWSKEKIALVSVRAYDEILWDYYDNRFKNNVKNRNCIINKAFKIKTDWVVSYIESDPRCLD